METYAGGVTASPGPDARTGTRPDSKVSPKRTRDPQRSKAAILAAARQHFAAYGLEATTIRAIAADAGLDHAMVLRYFGSKEKLFRAAVGPPVSLPDLTAVPRAEVGVALARAFVERWRDADTSPILLLTARSTHPVADRLHEAYRDEIAVAVAALGHPDDAVERASLAASHLIGLAIGRYQLFDDLRDMDDDTLVEHIAPALQHYLVGAR